MKPPTNNLRLFLVLFVLLFLCGSVFLVSLNVPRSEQTPKRVTVDNLPKHDFSETEILISKAKAETNSNERKAQGIISQTKDGITHLESTIRQRDKEIFVLDKELEQAKAVLAVVQDTAIVTLDTYNVQKRPKRLLDRVKERLKGSN